MSLGIILFETLPERELEAIGIPGKWHGAKGTKQSGYGNEQKRRNLTLHGLRNTFVTLGRLSGISDIEIQVLAGHKDASMMNQYSPIAQVMDLSQAKAKFELALLSPQDIQPAGTSAHGIGVSA